MKHQPAASNDQWSSPMMSRNCWRYASLTGGFGAGPIAVGLSPMS
ncbi:hypothetical protein ABIF34_002644 [Bradyrhizobium japonicum]